MLRFLAIPNKSNTHTSFGAWSPCTFNFWGFTTVLGILPTRYSCSPTAHKMDTSPGGPSQQPGPTPAALVLARSGGMPRVGALRLAASSAPTRPVPQFAIAARQEEEQSRLAIGPGNRIRPVGVADPSNTRVEVAAPLGAVMQHRTLVAGDGASTAAGILALPDAGPAALPCSRARETCRLLFLFYLCLLV